MRIAVTLHVPTCTPNKSLCGNAVAGGAPRLATQRLCVRPGGGDCAASWLLIPPLLFHPLDHQMEFTGAEAPQPSPENCLLSGRVMLESSTAGLISSECGSVCGQRSPRIRSRSGPHGRLGEPVSRWLCGFSPRSRGFSYIALLENHCLQLFLALLSLL